MWDQHVIYSEKHNAFSMILEAFFPFWTKIYAFRIGFYKVFRMRFLTSQKAGFPLVLQGFSTWRKRDAKTFSR